MEQSTWGTVVKIRNESDAPFQMLERSGAKLTSQTSVISIAPNGVTELMMNVDDKDAPIHLEFEVLNALIAPNKAARIKLSSAR